MASATRDQLGRKATFRGFNGGRFALFAAPAIVLYAFVLVVPSLQGVTYSFTDWNGLGLNFNWVGFANFGHLFADPIALTAIGNTLIVAAGITIVQTLTGLLLALAASSKIAGRNVYRALFFAPVMVMPVVTSYLWKYILGSSGALNEALDSAHLGNLVQPWLGQQGTALVWIVVVAVWQGAGVRMAIILAGLESIPSEVVEASELDGAGAIRQFFFVKLPLLRPATTVAVLLVLISSIKLFDQVWVLTGGGPANETDTLATRMYEEAFQLGSFSYGITFAVVLAVLVTALALIQQRVTRVRVDA